MTDLILTIGVYGFSEQEFFNRLLESRVDLFCDVRARRGMRGATYSFVNSKKLQSKLLEIGIAYAHAKEAAPNDETREAQREADKASGTLKRSRDELGHEFKASYSKQCLASLDAVQFMHSYFNNASRPVLFCVERCPRACHRSLLAEAIAEQTGLSVEHLKPCK